jgi:hypothetical protein
MPMTGPVKVVQAKVSRVLARCEKAKYVYLNAPINTPPPGKSYILVYQCESVSVH